MERRKDYNKVKGKLAKREARARARLLGFCPVCCARPTTLGFKTCTVCRGRGHDRNRLISELMRAFRAAPA